MNMDPSLISVLDRSHVGFGARTGQLAVRAMPPDESTPDMLAGIPVALPGVSDGGGAGFFPDNAEWVVALLAILISAGFAIWAQLTARKALKAAENSSVAAKKANKLAGDANDLSAKANRIAESANEHAKRAARSAADSESGQGARRHALRAQLVQFEEILSKKIGFAGKALEGWESVWSLGDTANAIDHMRGFLRFGPWEDNEKWPNERELFNSARGLSDADARRVCEAALRRTFDLRRDCERLERQLAANPKYTEHPSPSDGRPVEHDADERMELAQREQLKLESVLKRLESDVEAVNNEFNRVDRGEFL